MSYPVEIVVFCDRCSLVSRADYLVTEDMTQDERLSVARSHLAKEGWSHSDDPDYYTDLCRKCVVGVEVKKHGDGTFEVVVEDPMYLDLSADILRFGVNADQLRELRSGIDHVLAEMEDS